MINGNDTDDIFRMFYHGLSSLGDYPENCGGSGVMHHTCMRSSAATYSGISQKDACSEVR